MSKPFIHEDFLLETAQSRVLYHEYAEHLPIIDYHCHLPPADIARDRTFGNLSEIWLAGDHYKWRAMRTAGVDERYITGAASDWEKFEMWAATVPKTLRNPLYHWTHLELKRPFGITDRLLGPDTARGIWDDCNAQLASPTLSTQRILEQMHVEVVCTTDDPVDNLAHHKAIVASATCATQVLPTFRCDNAANVKKPKDFLAYLRKLGEAADIEVKSLADYIAALEQRHTYFHEHGCRLSDLGLETLPNRQPSSAENDRDFDKLLSGSALSDTAANALQATIMHELARMNHARGWVQQLHVGPLRDNNSRMLREVGPNTGFDSMGDAQIAYPLVQFLDSLDCKQTLAKTIIYNINPRDNELIACMIGSFQDGSTAGKIQYGSAWWFLDQLDGISRHLSALSNMSLLSQFVGMLTDSRSFLSYPRHEFFRRILCNTLGMEMQRGHLPDDLGLVGSMVSAICYHNAKRYFPFPRPNHCNAH